jgi:arylformamidase
MIIHFTHEGKSFSADLSRPLDISLPLSPDGSAVNAFYIPPVIVEPLRIGGFVGDVLQGGSCNVNTITFNPHGNGTHTESVGHISREKEPILECLRKFWYMAELISVQPTKVFDDLVILPEQLHHVLESPQEALIIRTRPNESGKTHRKYSGTNPPYLHHDAAELLAKAGVRHLLIDLPSVDKEDDGGKLLAHHAYWQYPLNTRTDATITELVYVPDEVKDGRYLLNLQIISIMNDASPSKPVLYSIHGN